MQNQGQRHFQLLLRCCWVATLPTIMQVMVIEQHRWGPLSMLLLPAAPFMLQWQ
jgi:hypothetical protein